MFVSQKLEVQLVLRQVLAKAEGVMPRGNRFSQQEVLMQQKLTVPACMENLIWEFANKTTDFDVIRDLMRKRLKVALSQAENYDYSYIHFRFADVLHKLCVDPDEDDSCEVRLMTYNEQDKWGCSFSFTARDIYEGDCLISAGKLTTSLLNNMHCRRHMCTNLLLHADELYCQECQFNIYPTGCKACGCRFGVQEKGYHPGCAVTD